jgi:hypothetical protein
VNAKTFPATNLRASSAVIIPASAGATIAPAVTAPNTKRANIAITPTSPLAAGQMSLYPLLTILTVATLKQLVW